MRNFNYLVSRTLACHWQEALKKVAELERQYNQLLSGHQKLSDVQRVQLFELANDVTRVWNDPKSDGKIKSRIVRLPVKEVWVKKILDDQKLEVTIHWHGGVHTQYELNRQRQRSKSRLEAKDQLLPAELIRRLALVCEDSHITRILNRIGYVCKPFTDNGAWTEAKVRALRKQHSIPEFSKEVYDQRELVNLRTASRLLGVSKDTVLAMIKHGIIEATQVIAHAPWEIPKSELAKPEVKHYLSTVKRGRPVSCNSDQLNLGIDERKDE